MSDAILSLPDDSANAGKKVDVEQLTVGANTVVRERTQVAGAAAAAIANVTNAQLTGTEYALPVRAIMDVEMSRTSHTTPLMWVGRTRSGSGRRLVSLGSHSSRRMTARISLVGSMEFSSIDPTPLLRIWLTEMPRIRMAPQLR